MAVLSGLPGWDTPGHCNLACAAMALLTTPPSMAELGHEVDETMALCSRSIYQAYLPCTCSEGEKELGIIVGPGIMVMGERRLCIWYVGTPGLVLLPAAGRSSTK